MPIVRILVMLTVCAIGGAVLLYFVTRDRKYLKFAALAGKVLVVLALVFFGVMITERLLIAL